MFLSISAFAQTMSNDNGKRMFNPMVYIARNNLKQHSPHFKLLFQQNGALPTSPPVLCSCTKLHCNFGCSANGPTSEYLHEYLLKKPEV
jgi:hypothetical protein